ncbi:CUT domain-containing protein [Meloidogyne graminicola]|uniref:CUT domain-containing protein n=1 Tax=Meloidogyne graminicola TaxID=189291 RepID=A0A8S9ZVB9_9BILA|nr:CUT domain-containing protein [Meloidogyne graminicola]
MVKTTESTTLLENNSSPNCLSQASDYDGNGFKNNQIKTQNGGTTSSELQTTSTNDYSTIVVPPSSSTTGHLTVEKYILQLQQKDERINTLKEENKRLRSTLISKTSEFQNRVDELVAELERQDEIVKKLRNDLAICRRTVSNPSTQITLKEPLSKKFSSLSASSSFSLQDSSSFPSNRTTNNSFKDIIEGNSDDICAKLQNFCERNNLGNIQQLQQQQQLPLETRKRRATKSAVSTPIKKQPCLEPLNIYQNANNNNDVDQENQLQQQQNLIPFTEQLCKLIAENPTTLLPAAALIFVSASITQPPPIEEKVQEKVQEEEEENIIEEEEQENYKNIKEENETFDQQQQQQTCSVDAETADNFLSFLMESTNGGANNSSTTVPTPCFTSTSSFCDNSQKKQKNNRRNKLRRNSTNNNQIIETPLQKQQNLDFEEVMQRVIGEAMNGTVNNSDNVVIEKQQNVLDQNKHKITTTTNICFFPYTSRNNNNNFAC